MVSEELLWRGNRTRVVGMSSPVKIKPSELVVGGRYLNRNGLFIREIEEIEGDHERTSSIRFLISGEVGSMLESRCATTAPFGSTRNLLKFQVTSPPFTGRVVR